MSRILILANSSSGLYDFRNELVTSLLEAGHRVSAALPDQVSTKDLEKEGVAVIPIAINRRGMNPLQDLKLMGHFKKLIRKLRPQLVITYTIKPNIYGGYVCRQLGVPYIVTITGLGSAFEKDGITRKLVTTMYRSAMRDCRCLFFQNGENRKLFESFGIRARKTCLVSGSGVDLTRHRAEPYPGHKGDQVRFLYVGRLMDEKGSREYLQACRKLRETYGDRVSVAAIGYMDGDYREEVESAIRDYGFHMDPYTTDIHPVLAGADVVVMPSYHEGLSNVLLEAAATARPVLASDISGCRETVDDGVSGFLFQPKDTDSLYRAMVRFLETPLDRRREMGQRGRAKMEREFDRHQVTASYLKEIQEIL